MRCREIARKRPATYKQCENDACSCLFIIGQGHSDIRARFCSHSCAASITNRSRVLARNINKPEPALTKVCPTCKSAHAKKSMFCSQVCISDKECSADFDDLTWYPKRRRVIAEQNNRCLRCGTSKWFDEPIPLEVDHIDGDRENDARDNLRALCPNCHSITPTWRNRKRNTSVTEAQLNLALKTSKNIRQALIAVDLVPTGGNYERANRLKRKITMLS